MAQLANFANVTSIVGAADIVIRSAKELYNFVEQVAAAPEDRLQLKSTLEKVTETVSTARQYAGQYRGSLYVVEDGLKPLQELENLLKDCDSEINRLHDVIKAFTLVPRTVFQDLRLRLGYVSREKAIKTACDRLQWQMVQIMLNLQVASGKHDIILREKVGSVDRSIVNVLSHQDKWFQDSQQAQISSTRFTQKMISDLDHRVASNHEVVNFIAAKIDEVSRHVMSAPSTLTKTPDISFKGRGLEYLIAPLSQISFYLQNIIQPLVLERRMLSTLDRDWIGTELAHLLASAHEAAARSLRRLKMPNVFEHQFLSLMPMNCETDDIGTQNITSSFDEHLPKARTIGTSRFHAIVKTAGGLLTVECNKKYQGQQGWNESYQYLELRFLFSPAAINATKGETTGVFLLLSREWVPMNSLPKLTRFIREVNVVPLKSKAFRCVLRNDVAGLRRLFAAREASPFDYDEAGRSLLCWAALSLQLECVELLLEQGANSDNCHLGVSAFTDLSCTIRQCLVTNYLTLKMFYPTIRERLPLTEKTIAQAIGADWRSKLDNVCEKLQQASEHRDYLLRLARILHRKGQNETVDLDIMDDIELEELRKWQNNFPTTEDVRIGIRLLNLETGLSHRRTA